MLQTLQLRIILLFTLSLITIVFFSLSIIYKEIQKHYEEIFIQRGLVVINQLALKTNYLFDLGLTPKELYGYEKLFHESLKNNEGIRYIALLDNTHKEIFSAGKSMRGLSDYLEQESMDNPYIMHIHLENNIELSNSIVVIIDENIVDENVLHFVQNFLFYVLLVIFIGIITAYFYLRINLGKPLNSLVRYIQKSSLDLPHENQELRKRKDELGIVYRAFNQLIDKLFNSQKSLRESNDQLLQLTKNLEYEVEYQTRILKQQVLFLDEYVSSSETDLEGNITDVSQAFSKITGYTKEELIGQNHRILKHPDMPDSLYTNLWNTITNNEIWNGEVKNTRKDKTFFWVDMTIYPKYDNSGETIGYIACRHDITDKKLIEEISITDGLTGIYNRRHFNELFPKLINAAKRNDELVSFLIMDIDYFKNYNDTYGHQMGDDVLIQVANTIESSLKRGDDYCFRLGGEEFGVIFQAQTKQKAIEFADTIRTNIEALQIEHKANDISHCVTVSMGLVCQSAHEIDYEEKIYKAADDLLYEAKKEGRNRLCYK